MTVPSATHGPKCRQRSKEGNEKDSKLHAQLLDRVFVVSRLR